MLRMLRAEARRCATPTRGGSGRATVPARATTGSSSSAAAPAGCRPLLPRPPRHRPRGPLGRRGAGRDVRRLPIFERLISPTHEAAPVERTAREYERSTTTACSPRSTAARARAGVHGPPGDVPRAQEMEAGLRLRRARRLRVRYGCRWESTRRDDGRLVLATTDGEYRCRAAVFAIGVTEPWMPACRASSTSTTTSRSTAAASAYEAGASSSSASATRPSRSARASSRGRPRADARLAAAAEHRRGSRAAAPPVVPDAVRRARARRARALRPRRVDRAGRARDAGFRGARARPHAAGAARARGRRRDRRDRVPARRSRDLPELGVATVATAGCRR